MAEGAGRATLEVCVDAPADFDRAVAAGVARIELCSALGLGGLTPTEGLIRHAMGSPVPVYAMIRPRAGHFRFTDSEVQCMRLEIQRVHEAGLAGVVLGLADAQGQLDEARLRPLVEQAGKGALGATLHRVVDTLPDPVQAVAIATRLGFERILTSGGADKAPEGLAVLERMLAAAAGRIEIMAGSGVTAEHVPALAQRGIVAFHASCRGEADAAGTCALDPQRLTDLQRALEAL